MTFNPFRAYVSLISCLAAAVSADALGAARSPAPSAMYRPMGGNGPLLGGGIAHTYDSGSIDANPAGVGLNQFAPGFFLGGETYWIDRSIQASEASVIDSASAEIAAGLKMRRTTKTTGLVIDRYSLSAAERVGESLFILGLGGDFEQIKDPVGKADKKDNWRLRAGLIYQPTINLFIGARSDGYFDVRKPPFSHAIGASWNWNGYAFFNGDLFFDDTSLQRSTVGVSLSARTWLDLVVGYGYENGTQAHGASAGISVKSEKFKLYCYLTKPDLSKTVLEQSFGAVVNLLALDKDKL